MIGAVFALLLAALRKTSYKNDRYDFIDLQRFHQAIKRNEEIQFIRNRRRKSYMLFEKIP